MSDYETPDLYFAAFLKSSKIDLINTRKLGTRVFFVFSDPGSTVITDLRMSYVNRTGSVIALDFADNVKALKSLCHL